MKIVCVCTDLSNQWLEDWLQSAKMWGYTDIHVVGQGLPWEGFATLYREILLCLDACHHPDEVVLVTDCYDVVFTGPVDELIAKYNARQGRVILGCESECGPNCRPLVCGDAKVRERFLNSGFVMGKVQQLQQLVTRAQQLC